MHMGYFYNHFLTLCGYTIFVKIFYYPIKGAQNVGNYYCYCFSLRIERSWVVIFLFERYIYNNNIYITIQSVSKSIIDVSFVLRRRIITFQPSIFWHFSLSVSLLLCYSFSFSLSLSFTLSLSLSFTLSLSILPLPLIHLLSISFSLLP